MSIRIGRAQPVRGLKEQHIRHRHNVFRFSESQRDLIDFAVLGPVKQTLDPYDFFVDLFTSDDDLFLSIGVVKAKKNLHTLLPMMDLLPHYRLLIAGNDSDPYAQSLRQQLAQHPNVSMLGTVSDNQRRWLYANCSALLFPSLAEGFGLPVIEAMQWGRPVFCSRLTSLPEIGSSHAYYFNDFSPLHMAETVKQGLADFNSDHAESEKHYAATFSFQTHMQHYWQLYTNALKGNLTQHRASALCNNEQ